MAKKKSYRRYAKKIPIALTAGLAATVLGGMDEGGRSVLSRLTTGEYEVAIGDLIQNLTGYNIRLNTFDIAKTNLMPLFIGALVSLGASKLGINRRLASIGLPVKL